MIPRFTDQMTVAMSHNKQLIDTIRVGVRIKIFIANKIHDVKRGGGGPALSVTMTLIFTKIIWTCPLTKLRAAKKPAPSK